MELDKEIFEMEATDECRTCMGNHDDAVHNATMRIRQWLRAKVNFEIGYGAALASAMLQSANECSAKAA